MMLILALLPFTAMADVPVPDPTPAPTIEVCLGEPGVEVCPEGCNLITDDDSCRLVMNIFNERMGTSFNWGESAKPEDCGVKAWGQRTCVANYKRSGLNGKFPPAIRMTNCHGKFARWICSSLPTQPTPAPTANNNPSVEDIRRMCAKFHGDKKGCTREEGVDLGCKWDKNKEKCQFYTCDSFNSAGWKCDRKAKKLGGMACYWDFDNEVCTSTKGTFPCTKMNGDKKGCRKKMKTQWPEAGCYWEPRGRLCLEHGSQE